MIYSLTEEMYDEVNAELARMAAIAAEEEQEPVKIYVGTGDIHVWEFHEHGK